MATGDSLIPDGSIYLFKHNNKVTSRLQALETANSGVTYTLLANGSSGGQSTINLITNETVVGTTPATTDIILVSYTSQNKPSASTPLPVVYADDKVYATNSHSIYKGAMITASATDKIAVGNGANGFEQKVLENITKTPIGNIVNSVVGSSYGQSGIGIQFTFASGYSIFQNYIVETILSTSWSLNKTELNASSIVDGYIQHANGTKYLKVIGYVTTPTHSTISLDNSNSSAVKYFTTITKDSEDNAVMQVQSKEMVYNSGTTSYDGDDEEFNQEITDTNGASIKTKTISYKLPYKVKG